jgi:hypothetical protein
MLHYFEIVDKGVLVTEDSLVFRSNREYLPTNADLQRITSGRHGTYRAVCAWWLYVT